MSGFPFKKADDIGSGRMGAAVADRPIGQTWSPYRTNRGESIVRSKSLVKTGGGGSGSTGQQEGGGGGGGNEPLGCPKCMPWWLVPLAAIGVMQAAAWLLARK